MAVSASALQTGYAAIKGAGTYISLHSGDPGTTGANEIAAVTRVSCAAPAANNNTDWAAVTLSVPAGATPSHFGVWSAATGGTFLWGASLGGTATFEFAGQLIVVVKLNVKNP